MARGIGVGRQEVPQRHEQLARVLPVVAGQRRADVVAQHVADRLGAVLLMEKVVGERHGGDLGNVLVLGHGQDFRLAQVAQGNTVLEADHGRFTHPRSILLSVAPGALMRINWGKGLSVTTPGARGR